MNIAIDLVILFITGFCVWRGSKNGIIRGICGVLALVISIFAANMVATAYSGEFTGMLKPFVGGIVDGVVSDILDKTGINPYAESASGGESGGIYGFAYSTLRELGLPPNAAESIADVATGELSESVAGLSDSITDKLSSVLAHVAVFSICFILLAIIFAVIGNVLNFVFSIPGLEMLDSLLGAVFGLAKGLLVIFSIAIVLRYIGLISSPVVDKTIVLKYIVSVNPIAMILGV